MTAKTAATAITALIAIVHLGACNSAPSNARKDRPSPAAFESEAAHGLRGTLVAGDALGVELHLAACVPLFAEAAR